MVHSLRALALAGSITAVFACSSSSSKERTADEGALSSEKDPSAEPAPTSRDGGDSREAGARADGSGSADGAPQVECTDNAGCPVTDDPAICGPAQCIEGRCIFSFC